MPLSLDYYARDQGETWDDRWITPKELLRNELICLCKYTCVLSSRHKASLLRGPFLWALLGLRLMEIFPGAGVNMTAMLWKPSSLPRVPLSQDKNCDKEELLIKVSELPVFALGQGTRLSSLPQTLQAPTAQTLGDLKARLWPKF